MQLASLMKRGDFLEDKNLFYKMNKITLKRMPGIKVASFLIILSFMMMAVTGCTSTDNANTAAETEEARLEDTGSSNESADTSSDDVSEIDTETIPDFSDDFILGMDASSVLAEENSGVVYYDFDGNEQDVFKTLAESGVNYIRLRVWNDPYDENGNGYGGGNNDLETAIALGSRATNYGMKVYIDFHYSDFWADPKRQHAPKAWEDMTVDEKADALYEYTYEGLTQLIESGVDVSMVQIGNEINNGMSGETDTDDVITLLKAASSAVRAASDSFDKDIKIAVHYTDIQKVDAVYAAADRLKKADLDYDIFAVSYYPYWHGSFENMKEVLATLKENTGKDIMIAETAYCYTSKDGDGSANSFTGKASELVDGYPATVEGQASMISDICVAANEAGAIGVFYWEGTWIPVGPADQDNSALWEKYGSGWASSFAADYDPEDAGLYYGGCSWDNQALFDFTGHPLESLKVFDMLGRSKTQ